MFKNKMIDFVVAQVIASFLKAIDSEHLKAVLDGLIDQVEEYIVKSPNTLDDNLLPVLKFARDFFAIPDLPDNQ